MTAVLLGLLVVALCVAGAVIVLDGRQRSVSPSLLELRFGSGLSEAAVLAALSAIAGLRRGATVALEARATEDGVRHFLSAQPAAVDALRGQLRALLPGTRLEPAPTEGRSPGAKLIAVLSFRGPHVLLASSGGPESAAALLGALGSPLRPGESLTVRWTLAPSRAPLAPRAQTKQNTSGGLASLLWPGERVPTGDQERALRTKYARPLLRAHLLVVVESGHQARRERLLARITSVVRARRGARGHLDTRRLGARRAGLALSGRPARGSMLLSPAELAGIVAWPIGAPQVPGLSLGVAPVLLPPRTVPTHGRVLARSNASGMTDRPLAQPVVGGLSHALVAGGTGSGKSTLIAGIVAQDMQAGRGALVIDMKGDLIADLLALVPSGRESDVVVLDPAASGPIPGLQLFGAGTDAEITADVVLSVVRSLSVGGSAWGPWSEKWLRAGLVTLAHDTHPTLADLPFVFTSETYRRKLIARIRDPLLLATWAGFDAMSDAERLNQLAAPLGRVQEIVGRRSVRAVLGQQRPTLDLSHALSARRIVLVALPSGVLGAPAARLLGALVVHALFQAVLARAALAPGSRQPFFAYLDEVKVLADLPTPIADLYEIARGMGVGVLAAPQSLWQLPDGLRRAVLANAGTVIAFRQSHDDATILGRELAGISTEELQHLGRYEVAARIALGPGHVTPVVTGVTMPPADPVSDPASVRRAAGERFGTDPALVDEQLGERHGLNDSAPAAPPEDVPVGRRRRAS